MANQSGRPGGLSSDDGAASVSTLRASIPDALQRLSDLVNLCETSALDPDVLEDVFRVIYPKPERIWITDNTGSWTPEYSAWQQRQARVFTLIEDEAYLDAAVAMLPEGAIWRKYTDECCSVYGASPYNAKAQVRFDGFNKAEPMAICAALLRMVLAPLQKAQAIEARRAETGTGSVEDESAVGATDAPKDPHHPPMSLDRKEGEL